MKNQVVGAEWKNNFVEAGWNVVEATVAEKDAAQKEVAAMRGWPAKHIESIPVEIESDGKATFREKLIARPYAGASFREDGGLDNGIGLR